LFEAQFGDGIDFSLKSKYFDGILLNVRSRLGAIVVCKWSFINSGSGSSGYKIG
jgi:hypothetical protein